MHRSGTSLISRFLQNSGLFMGWNRDSNDEAWFFLGRNEVILKSFGLKWEDKPSGVDYLISFRKDHQLISKITTDINSILSLNYLGSRNYKKYRSLYQYPFPWGWKDPRNTLLLPFWLKIFPRANIIHVIRNGIDVASSLSKRELLRRKKVNNKSAKKIKSNRGLIKKIVLEFDYRIIKRRYNQEPKSYISKQMTLSNAFELWKNRLTMINDISYFYNSRILNIRYEDFLQDPLTKGNEILSFLNIEPKESLTNIIEKISINDKRAFAYINELDQNELEKYITDPYMKLYGYSKIT